MRYFIVLIFQNLACILYLEFISIWASYISDVQMPPVTSGYNIGRHRCRERHFAQLTVYS